MFRRTVSLAFMAGVGLFLAACGDSPTGPAGAAYDQGPSLIVEPPAEDCHECKGGVNTLALVNNGPAGTVVVKDNDGNELYHAVVSTGIPFVFVGKGEGQAMGPQITITVDGGAPVIIDTSCSTAIGVGSVFGAFTVLTGSSTEGGALGAPGETCTEPPVECAECKGGVTELTLRNDGAGGTIVVKDKDGNQLFNGFVATGSEFSFVGVGKDGKLGTEIRISVDGGPVLSIHTSCSQPIGVGSVFGAFT
ncbi:MAG TPA: hypothetical protein VJ997_07345, partial [Longimicrobiales bacterium]|nr:hypothetical protein [Longimicrobiales bacterium]